MPISYELVKSVTKQLYESSLKGVPEDTRAALRAATEKETDEVGKSTLFHMLESAEAAGSRSHYVCSDSGIPVYFVQIGTRVQFDGNIKQAISDGFDELTQTIEPPLLKHITNPLTGERGYKGKDMPIVSYDLIDGADYVEIVCAPKGFGAGRWAAQELFSYPTLAQIEKFVLDTVIKAGSRTCPPVVIGVGIGGTFDHAAKIAKRATLRKVGEKSTEPIAASMEERLLKAVNKIGIGPMGTGGDTTALAVNVEYSSGHGFTPIAVCFNCWINRRARARIYNNGEIVRYE
jgi:fumarate hydratase subunit alpha